MTRKERIERLFYELKYEVVHGVMEGEIDETMVFEFFVPSRTIKDGVVHCKFKARPIHRGYTQIPRLRLVSKEGDTP